MYIFIGLGKPIRGDEKICDKIMFLNIRHFLLNPIISLLHVTKLVYRYGNFVTGEMRKKPEPRGWQSP